MPTLEFVLSTIGNLNVICQMTQELPGIWPDLGNREHISEQSGQVRTQARLGVVNFTVKMT